MRGSSRLKMELSGVRYTEQEIIQAKIADTLALLLWAKTEDGANNRNRPLMITDVMLGKEEQNSFEHDVFDSPEEFLEAHRKAVGRE